MLATLPKAALVVDRVDGEVKKTKNKNAKNIAKFYNL